MRVRSLCAAAILLALATSSCATKHPNSYRAEDDPTYQNAQHQISNGELTEAVGTLKGLLGKQPDSLQIRYLLANTYLLLALTDQAESELEHIIQIDNRQSAAFYELALIQLRQFRSEVNSGSFNESAFLQGYSFLVEALELDPENFTYHMELSRVFIEGQDFKNAKLHAAYASSIEPERFEPNRTLYEIAIAECDQEAAIEQLRTNLRKITHLSPTSDIAIETEQLLIDSGESALSIAILKMRNEDLQSMLEQGFSPNAKSGDGNTPLHTAAVYPIPGFDAIHDLLKYGAHIDAQNNLGITPLMTAALVYRMLVVEQLLDAGADVNIRSKFRLEPRIPFSTRQCGPPQIRPQTLLNLAVYRADVPLAKMALEYGADPNIQIQIEGGTSLHTAAERGNTELVELLLTHGAIATRRDFFHHTPYDLAVANHPHDKSLHLLLKAETEAYFAKRYGWSAKDFEEWDRWQSQWRFIDGRTTQVSTGISKHSSFEFATAQTTAVLAGLAYGSESVADEILSSMDFTIRKYISPRSLDSDARVQVLAATQKDVLVIAFRGTATWSDVLLDLKIVSHEFVSPMTPSGVKVHSGFLEGWLSIREKILELIKEYGENRSVVFTGHSLGAAVATIGIFDLAYNTDHYVTSMYAFGSPKVGNGAFQEAFDSVFGARFYDFQNDEDVVVHLPPGSGYERVGIPLYIDSEGFLFPFKREKSLLAKASSLSSISSDITDHFLNYYFQQLTRGPDLVSAEQFSIVMYGISEQSMAAVRKYWRKKSELNDFLAHARECENQMGTKGCDHSEKDVLVAKRQLELIGME